MLLVQIRAAQLQLKSDQALDGVLSAGDRGANPFVLQISLISSLMDCPVPGSVSGELHSARPHFFPQPLGWASPPIPVFSVFYSVSPEARKQQVLCLTV